MISKQDKMQKAVFKRYAAGAKQRGYSFDLTYEQVCLLINASRCTWCKRWIPNWFDASPKHPRLVSTETVPVPYLGIDRVENTLGYSYDNCVPCCAGCNYLKGDMPLSDWFSVCYSRWGESWKPIEWIK